MNDLTKTELSNQVKALDTRDVAEWLGLRKHRQKHKWGCPSCGIDGDGEGDNLNINVDSKGPGARCWACDAVFSNQDLAMHVHGIDFMDATMTIADAFGMQYPEVWRETFVPKQLPKATPRVHQRSEKQVREEPDAETVERLWSSRQQVLEHMYFGCELGERASDYLVSRNLDPGMCSQYSGLVSVENIEQWQALAREFDNDQLSVAGLKKLHWSNVYPFDAPFLVFPYLNEQGQLNAMRFGGFAEGRKEGRPKYIGQVFGWNVPQYPFGLSMASFAREHGRVLFVVEGEVNTLSVAQVGECCIGGCGAGSWLKDWGKYLKGVQVVVLVDPDKAGLMFAKSVLESMLEHCPEYIETRFKAFDFPRPGGKSLDANDLLQDGRLVEALAHFKQRLVFEV
jgi:DNA primase